MSVPVINRRDLDFMLHEWLDIGALFARPAYADHARETVDAMLDLATRIATDKYLPHFKQADRQEPRLDDDGVHVLPAVRDAVRATAEAGLFAAGFPASQGGMDLPSTVFWAAMGILQAANVSTSGFLMLTSGNARLIATFGTEAQKAAFAAPQIEGRWCGTMCLSEPQAGSSLADITTRAEPDGREGEIEGEDALGPRYRLRGNKMWISGGDHDATPNIVHLVLAKVPGPDGKPVAGTRGISLFIVPKFLPDDRGRNDIVVAGLNHKMGFRGIPNCLLNLGEGRFTPGGRAGAVGYLVGGVGQGLPIMFQMMNEARIGVGLGAAMLGYRGYMLAKHYATERIQGRAPDAKTRADAAPVAIIAHADVKRMLLAQKAYAEGALALVLYAGRLVDEERSAPDEADRQNAAALLGLLTPVVKTWPSEYGLAANDLAIQVHGGYGYTRDFDVEQLYRDNRLNPIHEGTTGIQALDLLGRKILRENAATLTHLRRLIDETAARSKNIAELSAFAPALLRAWDRIGVTIADFLKLNDDAAALAQATPFLSAFGHAVLAWIWLDQACAASRATQTGPDQPYYAGKIRACRYFFEAELPKIHTWLDFVATMSDVASCMPADQF
jgi:alkylation response protein AidB-like acyl-CoA dehydrogenase